MSVNTKMTAIADEVRTLSGTTDPMGLDDIATYTKGANTEVTSQTDLISQIRDVLESKAAPSSDSVETCTLTVSYGTNSSETTTGTGTISSLYYTAYEDGAFSVKNVSNVQGPVTISNIVKNSVVYSGQYYAQYMVNVSSPAYNVYVIEDDNAVIHSYSCFVRGTKILLADRTTKEVQDITYDDNLLVWDFDNARNTSAKPLWIKKAEVALYYYHCIFENGIELDLVGSDGNCHAVFCVDDNKFEYANKCVGKMVMTNRGATKLLTCEPRYDTVEFYNIITNYHMNCYANDVLTSTRLNNVYPIENMKFVSDDRVVIPYEVYSDIPVDFYNGLRLGERRLEDIEWITENVKIQLTKTLPKEI